MNSGPILVSEDVRMLTPSDKKYNLRRGMNSYTPEVFFIAPEK